VLSKLIYASQATRAMRPDELTLLLASARRNNEKLGLTGLLLYCNQSFLQVLEGEAEVIDALYQKIEGDPRHQKLRLLLRAPIDVRKYPAWSMGFDHVDEDRLIETMPGYQPATQYPLVSADLVRNATVAETLLGLYQRNTPDA
jgi:hypothetical protein